MYTVANIILWHQNEVTTFPESGVVRAFPLHYRYRQKEISEAFSPKFSGDKIFLCNNSDQMWFSNTFTSAGPLERCWNPHLSGSGFTTALRVQQMLMYRKSCLIPIIHMYILNTENDAGRTCRKFCWLSFKNWKLILVVSWRYEWNRTAKCINGDKQHRPRSAVWSWFTLFAQGYLSENLGLRYAAWNCLSHVMRKPVLARCEQQRCRSACASAQSDQHLCCSLFR